MDADRNASGPPVALMLARFANQLNLAATPDAVVERAKSSILDTIGVAGFCAGLPWSRMIQSYAAATSAPGKSTVFGAGLKLQPALAALTNGAQAHAFEMDGISHPSVGIHPGAALTSPGFAVAEAEGSSGVELLTAFIAGCEVMYRIGDAARETSEKLGFHAPGLNGVFGSAVTAGRLMKLTDQQLANALGIAVSLCGGVLEFSRSGGMVKCMHIGRAAEAGVIAANLARSGFIGPATGLEGKFGFLNVFARDGEAARFTANLGQTWHTLKILLKRFACHITSHVPVTIILDLKRENEFSGDDVASIRLAAGEKVVSHHSIYEPRDLAMAQYSAPFNAALACYRDPRDPSVYSETTINDPAIRSLCRRVLIESDETLTRNNRLASRVAIRLRGGRILQREAQTFPGMPEQPLSRAELREKFDVVGKNWMESGRREEFFDQIFNLESLRRVPEVIELRANSPEDQ